MADEPMSDERLAEIRASVHNINERGRYSGAVSPSEVIYASDASDLLAEVDRLRAREATAMEALHRLYNDWAKGQLPTQGTAMLAYEPMAQAAHLLNQETADEHRRLLAHLFDEE